MKTWVLCRTQRHSFFSQREATRGKLGNPHRCSLSVDQQSPSQLPLHFSCGDFLHVLCFAFHMPFHPVVLLTAVLLAWPAATYPESFRLNAAFSRKLSPTSEARLVIHPCKFLSLALCTPGVACVCVIIAYLIAFHPLVNSGPGRGWYVLYMCDRLLINIA